MVQPWEVTEWIRNLAIQGVDRFYPTALSRHLDVGLDEAFRLLLDAAKSGSVELLWEVRCPNLECVRAICLTETKPLERNEINCSTCGEEITITPDGVYPVFAINREYSERVKKKHRPCPQNPLQRELLVLQ